MRKAEIKDFPDYEIYEDGRVWSKRKKKFLAGMKSSKYGLYAVQLRSNGRRLTKCIHILLAEAFIPNPHNLETVYHKNRDFTDNRLSNLTWCSKYDPRHLNIMDKHNKGIGETHSQAKLSKKEIKAIKLLAELGIRKTEIAKMFHVVPSNIGSIIHKRSWISRRRNGLNLDEVEEIRVLLQQGKSLLGIALKYGCSETAIRDIRDGRTWCKAVTEEN